MSDCIHPLKLGEKFGGNIGIVNDQNIFIIGFVGVFAEVEGSLADPWLTTTITTTNYYYYYYYYYYY